MSMFEQTLTHLLSAVVIAGMLALCLRSRGQGEVATGRRIYRIHPGWFVFCGLGGAFLVGIFAFASTTAEPVDRPIAAWCSAISAIFFVITAIALRAVSVTIDNDQLTSRTLVGERSVALRDIDKVAVKGLAVQLRLRVDPRTQKRPRSLTFLAGFRGLGELLATLRHRASSPS
jgi:hypothetical protein